MKQIEELLKTDRTREQIAEIDRNILPVQNAEGKWGFMDKRSSEVVIPFLCDEAEGFIAGKAEVILNGNWAMIDETGKIIM
ncbi:MAG: WG repeat-containing protein [Flavobacteriaceae bacterium]|jgi:hypothetical protein|nr:WG repeat-containing protein [Flavobacteriaceae bacterium]